MKLRYDISIDTQKEFFSNFQSLLNMAWSTNTRETHVSSSTFFRSAHEEKSANTLHFTLLNHLILLRHEKHPTLEVTRSKLTQTLVLQYQNPSQLYRYFMHISRDHASYNTRFDWLDRK